MGGVFQDGRGLAVMLGRASGGLMGFVCCMNGACDGLGDTVCLQVAC